MWKYFVIVNFLVLILVSDLTNGNSYIDSLEYANQQYMNGKFERAIESYHTIIDSGYEAPELYYNLGNAYYKTYKIAHAVYFYEKALRLAPNDKDIQHNLTVAQTLTVDEIDVLPEFFVKKWLYKLSVLFALKTWAIITIISFVILLMMILFYLFMAKISIKKLTFWVAILFFFICVVSFNMSMKQKAWMMDDSVAIIFSPSVNIKSSPDINGTDLFVLHEGTKVNVIDSIGEWREITLSDGNQGWLLKTDIKTLIVGF